MNFFNPLYPFTFESFVSRSDNFKLFSYISAKQSWEKFISLLIFSSFFKEEINKYFVDRVKKFSNFPRDRPSNRKVIKVGPCNNNFQPIPTSFLHYNNDSALQEPLLIYFLPYLPGISISFHGGWVS